MSGSLCSGCLVTKSKYCEYDVDTFNQKLSKFWFEARTQDGDYYTTASLGHIRYGINQCLAKHSLTYNIVDGTDFKPSQLVYRDATKEFKKMGKGFHRSYPAIKSLGQNNIFLHQIYKIIQNMT